MSRFVAAGKDNRIKIVSDHPITDDQFIVLEVPKELKDVSDKDLILGYRIRNGKVVSKITNNIAKELKVAIITNYMQQCGISTYSENLIPELIKYLGDFRLFVEENNQPTGQFKHPDKTVVCWKRGQSPSKLVSAIKEYDPDIIWINHEYGLFPDARHWLSLLTQLSEYRIITTLHSVFPYHFDKTICEAATQEIIVHLDGAKKALEDKGVNSKISIIPHGCYPCIDDSKLWNIYRSPHTFIQQGFGFTYKRFQLSIKAVGILKAKYPDIFFTALFSESPFNKVGHQVYYNELIDLIAELKVEENVAIIRGYQSEEVIDKFFRTNQVAVFPYGSDPNHIVFGSSGAARLSMSKGVPTITSSIPHFSDLPTIKADTAEQIADELDKLFSDPSKQKEQIKKQLDHIKENSWENVALQYIGVFENN